MKKGYIYSIISAVLFGSAGLFVKYAHSTGLESVSLLTIQYIFAIIIMFSLIMIKNNREVKVNKRTLINLAIMGVVGNTFMTVFYYKAFEYLPVPLVTILLYTYPIMVFFYSTIFKKEKVTLKKSLAVALAFFGCILTLELLSGEIQYSIKGITYGILCAIFYAFMNIFTESKLENVPPLTINAYSTLFSLIALLIYKPLTYSTVGSLSVKGISSIIILAVFCEVIPLTLLYAAISYIGALKVSIIANLEVPSAVFIAFLFLGETVSITQAVGIVLVIVATMLIK
ncbi:DMT family transporter [Haloimpatiens massiliensis]|uniref:DMT family transporter n=1 Tax=Haloimpatiens massiliensis TaxID=1658110 RepID=UPI000C824BAA|nr:DMT family transporter [Haloimpatiens massiliensis]